MTPERTALLLIGFQNDYFAEDGALHGAVEDPSRFHAVLDNTLGLIGGLANTAATIISTPIVFTPDYRELADPVGILKTVRDLGAFHAGSRGAETIPGLRRFGERILEVPGKRGLNAFVDTDLDRILRGRGIDHLAVAGVLTSVCIDSTSRSAVERGYRVTILSDCTFGRNDFEQAFYCDKVFPLYANVMGYRELIASLRLRHAKPRRNLEDEEADFLIQQRLFEELSAAEKRYRELVENLRNILFRYDSAGRLTFVNRAWRDTLGHAPEQSVHRPFSDFVQCDNGDCDAKSLLRDQAGGVRELSLRHAGGQTLVFELTVRGSPEGGGVGLLYDVTRQRQRERQLRQAMLDAQAGTEAKSRFLATMSHEIRTPMNGVMGMADLLSFTNLDPEQREFVDTIQSSGRALLSIIEDILHYSKIESGNAHLERQPLAPRAVVDEVRSALQPKAEKKGITLTARVGSKVPRLVLGDPVRLRQILVNLGDNAVKFTDQGGVLIEVTGSPAEHGRHTLGLRVCDSGIGIPAEQQEALFEPFTQADSSITRKYGGIGLGLAMATRLVELMGGELQVESEPGRGSTFHFTIVADGAAPDAEKDPGTGTSQPDEGRL